MRLLEPHTGAAAVLVDEFYAGQLKRPSKYRKATREAGILSFFLGRIGSFATDCFRGSRRFGRCCGFCGARGSGPRKTDANRRNAAKSTGPMTQCGKLQSRRNAMRHGLTAATVVPAMEDKE